MRRTPLRYRVSRLGHRTVAIGSGAVLLAGCQFGGLNSLNMPGTAGHGAGSYTVTVELPDVATLPQNSPVMVDDVTVGSVSGIDAVQRPDGTFYAAVQLSLDGNVNLPANATATVAQTSLLGSQHVELAEPVDQAPVGRLAEGSNIAEARTGRYPTTEEVLSSLGVVVNKGNLGALQDITDEVYAAVVGRAGSFTDLVPRLAELTSSLDRQTTDIIAAAEGLNRFAAILAGSKDSLGRTLDALPAALDVLNNNRANIVDAFGALQSFATVAANILAQTKEDFAADFKDLYPIIKSFNDNADFLIKDLEFLPTFPFHYKYLRKAVRGDYLNVFVTFDLTLRRLGESVFTTRRARPEHEAHERGDQPAGLPDRSDGEPVRPGGGPVQDPARHGDPARGGTVDARPTDPNSTGDLRIRHGAHRRGDLGVLSSSARRGRDRFLQGHRQFRCRRRDLRERERHLPRRHGRTGGIGRALGRRRRRAHAAEQQHTRAGKCHGDGQERSAVGEQYIDLVPPDDPAGSTLRDGSNIGVERTAIGQDIAGLLQEADALVSSVGDSRLQDLLSETFKAFNGSGPELARLIQSGRLLVDEANANYGQVSQLIDQAGPFLDAQIRGGDDIRSLADGLARFTGEVANADPQVRSVLQTAPGAAARRNETFSGIRPTFPVLAANLANFGRIGVIYHKSLEQALVIFPALMAALNTVAGGVPADEGGKLDFKIHIQDPPGCSVGFIPPPLIRSPADTTLRELPDGLYCKVPHNDPSVVRGARNYPCQEFPGKRAPTVQLCRDPKGYVPIGSNPWRGPHPGGYPMDEREPITTTTRAEYPAAQQVPDTSHRRWIPIRDHRWCSCHPGCRRVPARRRTRRSRCRCRRTSLAPRRRRGRTSHRRTRSCRRTAERRRPRGRRRRLRRRRRRRPRRCRRWPGGTTRPKGRGMVRPSRPMTRTPVSSWIRPAGLACLRPVPTNWRLRRTG